jgi:galactokinase
MTTASPQLTISTPGRVCLFGEHQDYLQLPIIAAAISRRVTIAGSRRSDNRIKVDLPDIRRQESFLLASRIPYVRERDYFRSGVNVLMRKGFSFTHGLECVLTSNIPINAGTSSSSAILVGWTNFLARMSDQEKVLTGEEIAQIAYEAEVLEFTEPGGMMDQYSTAIGNLIWLESFPKISVSSMNAELKSFVLGNSNQPKNTKYILANVKDKVLDIVKRLKDIHPEFSLQTIQYADAESYAHDLDTVQLNLLKGTIRNRDITHEARDVLQKEPLDHRRIGALLTEHHAVLRDVQRISTPKIERMIDAALHAGAYGAKINGSGGGGCMFAYAPEHPERVREAVQNIGQAVIVRVDKGTKQERTEPTT